MDLIYDKYRSKFQEYISDTKNVDMFEYIHKKYYFNFYENIIDLTGLNIDKYFIEYYFRNIYCSCYIVKNNCTIYHHDILKLIQNNKKEIKTNLEIIFQNCF